MKKNLSYITIAYFLSRALFIGISSRSLINLAKQDAWITIVIAFIIGLIPIVLFYFIANNNDDGNIFDKINILFPKTKYIIKILLVFIVFMLTLINFWNLSYLIVSQFLSKTPKYAMELSLLLPIIMLTSKKEKVVARVSLILFFFEIFLIFISITGLIPKFELDNIKPILENNPIISCLQYISYNVLPIFMLLTFPNKKIKKSIIIGYILSSITLFITVLLIIGVLGIDLIQMFEYPEFHILKLAYQGILTFRLENILTIQWVFDCFMFICVGIKFCNDAFNVEKKYIIPIIIFIISSFISISNITFNNLITYIFPIIIPIFLFYIPLIIYIKQKKEIKFPKIST